MSGTSVPSGSLLALPQHSNAVTAQIIRAPGNLSAMTGPAPKGQEQVDANLKQQTSSGMPFVRITDLSVDPKGDTVYVDAFDVTGGKPIMGDRNAEGQGKALSSSSFPVKIDLATHNVDAGGKMARQRTRWDLRRIARAEVSAYFPRLIWQRCLAHLFGMRGSQVGLSWDIPVDTDPDFAEIMINQVKAPTRNRHYVLDDTNGLVQGGELVNSLATADVWKLARLDELALILESMETKIPSPRIVGDEQMYDSPLKGILMMPPGSYNSLITDVSVSGNNLRAYQAAVEQRQKWAPNSAVFRGECGIWRNILVKKMDHTIFRNAGENVQYVTAANRLTETETGVAVAGGLSTTHQMERSVLMGAQCLARAEGASNSGVQAAIIENTYNAGRNYEFLGEFMGGEAKFRFKFPNESGDKQPTDNALVIDAVARKVV
jgi:hypothetical protein